jgi:hypothetical protein
LGLGPQKFLKVPVRKSINLSAVTLASVIGEALNALKDFLIRVWDCA